MTILSWNCCLPPWSISRRRRLPGIISAILNTSPDVVCLQEVFINSDANLIINTLKKTGFENHFYFKDLLVLSKLPIANPQGWIFKHQGSMLSFAVLDKFYGKGFQSMQINDKSGMFILINTHLLSAYALSSAKYQNVRDEQVKQICKISDKHPPTKKLLAGDFNFQPNTHPYKALRSYEDLTNSEPTVKKGQLDYIFGKNVIKQKCRLAISDNRLSDHAAILVSVA